MTAVAEVRLECDGCGHRSGPMHRWYELHTDARLVIAALRADLADAWRWPTVPVAPTWEHRVVDDRSVDLCPTCKVKPWPPPKPSPPQRSRRTPRPARPVAARMGADQPAERTPT